MLTAGITEDADTYKHDLFTASGDLSKVSSKQMEFLKAFLMQITELEQVRSGRRLPERVLRHLVGTEIMQHRESSAPYIRLFGQYRNEWISLVRQAELNGYAWAKMMEGESRVSA